MAPVKTIAFRAEHTGTALGDRMQRQAQQAAQSANRTAGKLLLEGVYTAHLSAQYNSTLLAWTDIDGLLVTVPDAQPGDVLIIDFAALGSSSASQSQARVAVVDGGNAYTYATGDELSGTLGCGATFPSATPNVCPLMGMWTVQTRGDALVKIQGRALGGATFSIYAGVSSSGGLPLLRVQHLRAA